LFNTAFGAPVEIWFQDEARVGQQGTHAYIWAPVGARPLMVRDNRHDSAYIFGAICPQRGIGAAMITPAANTEMMNLHLAEISTQVAPGAYAVLLCDRAGWHQPGGELLVPDNIRLLHLPPYSPELNPMENVWDYLRQNKLCATVWDSYDDILEASRIAWNWLIADSARIRSIGTRDWAAVKL
jgi:transposase